MIAAQCDSRRDSPAEARERSCGPNAVRVGSARACDASWSAFSNALVRLEEGERMPD